MRPFISLLCLFLMAGFITNRISSALDNIAATGVTYSTSKNFGDWVNLTVPTISEHPGRKILTIGASQTFFGISPIAMDAELEQLGMVSTTYNMAYPALDPTTVEFLARHIASHWGDQEKADVLVVGFAPHFFTKKYAESDAFGLHNLVARAHLGAGFSEVPLLLKNSLNDGIQTLAMQFLNVEPGRPRKIVMELIEGIDPKACKQEFAASRGGQSCYGFGTMRVNEKNMRKLSMGHRRVRIEQADLLELNLDYAALDRVVNTIGAARQFSKQVVVVLTPRNIEIVDTTVQGIERLKSGLSYISQQADVEIIDFYSGDSGYEIGSFNDATHLNAEGAEDFSRELAELLYQKITLAEDDA